MSYQSFDGHGVDVAIKRADDLDKLALAYVTEHTTVTVLDLGSGAGGQSVRLATAGANVLAVDQFDFTDTFAQLRADHDLSVKQLQFISGDITQLSTVVSNKSFAITIMQRTLHYLTYSQAAELLHSLYVITNDKLYLSVTGSGSLVADTYPCLAKPILNRFCQLNELGRETFSIQEPVCLYNQAELTTLLESTGWAVDAIWISAFGNIKVVCSKASK